MTGNPIDLSWIAQSEWDERNKIIKQQKCTEETTDLYLANNIQYLEIQSN